MIVKERTEASKSYFSRFCCKHKLLKYEEEKQLAHRIKNGDEKAKQILIASNLRLVAKIARGYYRSYGELIPIGDLISYGIFGLFEAIKRFDPNHDDRSSRFSTYAVHWVRQSIKRETEKNESTIRLPTYIHNQQINFFKTIAFLAQNNDEEFEIEQIAEVSGLPVSKVRIIEKLVATIRNVSSLNSPMTVDTATEKSTFKIDNVVCENKSPEEELSGRERKLQINRALERLKTKLKPKEFMVIQERYFSSSNEIESFEKVGKKIGLTRQRAEQIEKIALTKARRILSGYRNVLAV